MVAHHSKKLSGREPDVEWLNELPKERLKDLLFLHIRNLWAVDGVYFLGIEERFGTEPATDIDARVWEQMAVIEARRLKKAFGITGDDIPSFMDALRHTSWSLDLEDKEIEIGDKRAVFRNIRCRVQNTRMKKGLIEFPCKRVRYGMLKAFAKEMNPKIRVNCIVCPPDEHPDDLWCEWEFVLEE